MKGKIAPNRDCPICGHKVYNQLCKHDWSDYIDIIEKINQWLTEDNRINDTYYIGLKLILGGSS